MNEITGITMAALHDERWVRDLTDPCATHRCRLLERNRSRRRWWRRPASR